MSPLRESYLSVPTNWMDQIDMSGISNMQMTAVDEPRD